MGKPEPCTTTTQTRCHWSSDLHPALGCGREGTTLCGQPALDQEAATNDAVDVKDIAWELPPCVICAALVAAGGHGNGQEVVVDEQTAAQIYLDGEPTGTPLWSRSRKLAERMIASHQKAQEEKPGWLWIDTASSAGRDTVGPEIVRAATHAAAQTSAPE
jgi:hypothetical protein